MYAVDVNRRALDLTRANAATAGAGNVVVARAGRDRRRRALRPDLVQPADPGRQGRNCTTLLATWLPRLAPGGTAWLVVARNLGADSLQRVAYRHRAGRPSGTPAEKAIASCGSDGPESLTHGVRRRRRAGHTLPDGRVLFADVSFRVGEGAKIALVGPNGAGKTTLLRMVAGDLPVQRGHDRPIRRARRHAPVHRDAGHRVPTDDDTPGGRPPSTRRFRSVARGARGARGRRRLAAAEAALHAAERRGKYSSAAGRAQLAYADALAAWGEAGGYEAEVLFDTVSVAVLRKPWEETRDRPVGTLSGGQQKRFALELLLRGPDEVLLLDEPDNFLDVPGKRWLEGRLRGVGQERAVRLARPGTAGADGRPGGGRGGRLGVGAPGRVRVLARRPVRPARAAGGEPPALGRGAREAAPAHADVQAEGRLQRRRWPRGTRPR